jgi:GDPmannose 4,6-dehydratase
MSKTALITGITGQDGSYLAESLLEKGYGVTGLKRRTSVEHYDRLSHVLHNKRFKMDEFEISDSGSVYSIVDKYKPDEIYNLAAQSHVGTSFQQPDYTFQVNAIGPMNFLEAVRRYSPESKFYQASTSEMFGKAYNLKADKEVGDSVEWIKFQDEETPFEPQSPYAIAKLSAHHAVRIYREAYDIFGCCGILFNHESERRGENFVTRKITKWIGNFKRWLELQPEILSTDKLGFDSDAIYSKTGRFPKLRLGNIESYRDWGHAKDYVEAMWLMIQQQGGDDYVIATGETHCVKEFLTLAFKEIGINSFEPFIVIDPKFYRPAEVDFLNGIPEKANEVLGWKPKIDFKELVQRMVWGDLSVQTRLA